MNTKNSNYSMIPFLGKVNKNEIYRNIYILNPQNTGFTFLYCTLMYTNMKYRIPNLFLFRESDLNKFKNDYINKKNIKNNPKELKKFNKIFHDIYSNPIDILDNVKQYNKIFDENEFALPLFYYKSCYSKNGYFTIDYYIEHVFPSLGSTFIFTDFLNNDFNNFDTFFEFFTQFFVSFIEYFDIEDKKNLKRNYFYTFKEIEDLSKKYHHILLNEIIKYQNFFRDFIDYTYNYTNDNDINTQDNISDSKKRFYIFRKTSSSISNHLIENIKSINSFDVEIYPYTLNHLSTKDELIAELSKDNVYVDNTIYTSTTNIFSYFYYLFYNCIFNKSYTIKKCKNCNKYFFTDFNSPKLYCRNIFNRNQTCENIGNQIAQHKKEQEDIVYGMYRKIYAKKAMLVKRNPDIESYKTEYNKWKLDAKELRNKLKENKITNEDFEKWLNENN